VLCGRYILPHNTKEILRDYPISEYGELQSIHLLLHIISNGGLQAIKMENMDMFDSGDPLAWLKSQIDHSLKREDFHNDISEWLNSRMK
jgi:UTP-glucose-1-phosphate uridylyltransferase